MTSTIGIRAVRMSYRRARHSHIAESWDFESLMTTIRGWQRVATGSWRGSARTSTGYVPAPQSILQAVRNFVAFAHATHRRNR